MESPGLGPISRHRCKGKQSLNPFIDGETRTNVLSLSLSLSLMAIMAWNVGVIYSPSLIITGAESPGDLAPGIFVNPY